MIGNPMPQVARDQGYQMPKVQYAQQQKPPLSQTANLGGLGSNLYSQSQNFAQQAREQGGITPELGGQMANAAQANSQTYEENGQLKQPEQAQGFDWRSQFGQMPPVPGDPGFMQFSRLQNQAQNPFR